MPAPRIFYWCQDSNQTTGGEKHNYQHVEILSRHGFEAFALHRTSGFRPTWFEHTAPIAYWDEIVLRPDTDYVVVSESLGLQIRDVPGRKVIFNKNIYSGFNRLGMARDGARVYLADDVAAILSVSAHNSEHLQFAYPAKPVMTVQASIRPDRFTFSPLSGKRRLIAYAAKANYDGRTLYQMLMGRAEQGLNRLEDVEWVPIVGMDERQVIATLQSTFVFLFLSIYEGLPRLPLEAMACGCLVCAYGCGAPSIILPAAYSFPYGDLLSMARRVEYLFDAFPHRLAELEPLTAEGRCIAERYSDRAQERTVIEAWTAILSGSTTAVALSSHASPPTQEGLE